jgi:hypothetical protein
MSMCCWYDGNAVDENTNTDIGLNMLGMHNISCIWSIVVLLFIDCIDVIHGAIVNLDINFGTQTSDL